MIIDVGVGTYTRQTFSKDRYKIWTMRSLYHNLPVINNQEEPYGRDYRAKSVTFDPQTGTFGLDMSNAYAADAKITDWHRSFTLTPNGLELSDEYVLSDKTAPTVLHFMIAGEVTDAGAGQYRINYKGTMITLHYDAERLHPNLEPIMVKDPRLTKVWGETIYRLALTDMKPSLKGRYTIRFTK